MKTLNIILMSLCFLSGISSFAGERVLIAESGNQKVQLLELYSSESCSSCPPADQWVSELKEKKNLWKSFVPVVFHVDYWNNLGWKDGLSAEPMTQRQIDVAKQWARPNVYTPAVVVDGQEWTGWRESRDHALPAVQAAKGIRLVLFRETNGSITVKAEAPGLKGHYKIVVAQLGMGIKTQVTAGENSGKLLHHDFAVLDWKSQEWSSLKKEENFILKAVDQKKTKMAIAAWIEEDGKPTPLQAVGGYL